VKRSSIILGALCILSLASCQRPGQNVYNYNEVGKTSVVNFGTVVAVREVNVQGQNTGLGAAAGAAAGGIAASQIGHGGGKAAATLGGVLIGGAVGALTEQLAANRKALEYTVTLETGTTITVVQDHNEGEKVIKPGDRVMVQVSGGTQRILPADGMPTQIQHPEGIHITN